jgi:anthranilate/para-aminobenzoate synthase component II
LRRAVIFNYNSKFADDIVKSFHVYNLLRPKKAFSIDMYSADKYTSEAEIGSADAIVHSGGDGKPVIENMKDVPRLYICFSHEWKAVAGESEIIKLQNLILGIKAIDVLEDDIIFGRRGQMRIMKYHELGIVSPPRKAKVIATSKTRDLNGKKVDIIEALRYPDGSVSVQGHPEEGRAVHIIYNFLERNIKYPAN